MFDADVLVTRTTSRLLGHPAGGNGENVVTADRHLVAEAGLRGLALQRAELGIGQEARRGIALQQPVDDPGQRRHQEVRGLVGVVVEGDGRVRSKRGFPFTSRTSP